MSVFCLPDLGEGLQQVEIVAWHVAEGDRVVADQPLVAVETDKAVVEVPSPQAGHVARLLGRPGDRIEVGAPLVEFEEGARADAGTVVGDLGASVPSARLHYRLHYNASPAVRALAQERGVDLAQLTGTGPGGLITRADVERADIWRSGAQPSTHGPVKIPASEALRGVRRSMALNMTRAHAEVAPATLWDEADIESWWMQQAEVTLRLVRAVAKACAAEPALNASYDGRAMTLRLCPSVDLGIAVDTEEGLIVPVLRNAGGQELAALREELDRLKAAVRRRAVLPEELRTPSITLSNFGTLAGRHAALVVLPPQVAIVGAGRIALRAAPGPDGPAFRHFLPLSLTFDHRVVTGGEAARFLRALIIDLERPE